MRKSTRLIALLMTLLMLVGTMPFATFAVPSLDEHEHQNVGGANEKGGTNTQDDYLLPEVNLIPGYDNVYLMDGRIYVENESGVVSEVPGWRIDMETGDVFYDDPLDTVDAPVKGLIDIEIGGVNYYFYFDDTTGALKKNYWSDEYEMYFGADGKPANGIVENVVIGGNNNEMMYFVDGHPAAAIIEENGMKYIFGDDGKLVKAIDLNAAEVVITIKKDGNTDILNFKPAIGAMFVYPVPNYLDYEVTVYDKDLNPVPPTGDIVMIVVDAVTGYTEYTIVYSEKTVAHDWVLKPEFSTPATCMDNGLNVFECSVCGKIKRETVNSTGEHIFNPFTGAYCDVAGCNHLSCGGWAKAREESCTTDGIRYTYCTVCNKGISYETIAAAHEWDKTSFTVIVAPICDEEGLAEYECKNCDATLVEKFRDENNRYHAGPTNEVIIKAPTCTAQGVAEYTCASCGGKWTDTVDKDPANHSWVKDGTTPLERATCYTKQEKWAYYCELCGERKEDVETVDESKWIHDYNEGVLNPEPTCGDIGLWTYTCQNPDCGDSYTVDEPATGLHDWRDHYDYDDTQHWYECDVCGDKKDAQNHTMDIWTNDPATGTHTNSCACGYAVTGIAHEYEVDEAGNKKFYTDEDGNHYNKCAVCGTELDEGTHVYEVDGDGNKVFYSEGDNHWNKCSVCGTKLDEETHAYDDDKDGEYHWKECECGKVIDQTAHEYTIPKYDDNYHWNECSCGAIDQEIAHTFTQNYDETNHWDECACGKEVNVTPHDYVVDPDGDKVFSSNDDYHWYTCSGCAAEPGKEAHTYGYNKDETHHWQECECGKVKGEKAVHEYTIPNGDDNYHWNECSCGAIDQEIAHTFTQNYDETNHWNECACGKKVNVTPHNYATDSNGDRIYSNNGDYHWYDCTDCEYATDKIAHNVTAIMEAKDPTCTQKGNSEGSWCSDCELVFEPVEYYGILSHDLIDVMVSDAEGHYYACRNCTSKIGFDGHVFADEWVSNDKEHKRTCLVCNARDPQSGAHNYLGEEYYTNIDDEEGTAITSCEFCGHKTQVEVLTWYEKLGMIKVDGKYYYPNPADGVNVTNKLVKFVDGVRFFGADGALVLTVEGVTDDALTFVTENITFQNARGVIDDAVITLAEGTYCVKQGDIQKSKRVAIGDRYYYFDENELMVKDKLVDVDGDGVYDYYFDKDGISSVQLVPDEV